MKKLMTEWRKAKKALLTEAAPWPAEGGESLEVTMRGIMNRLGRVEVNDKVWSFLIQQIKKSIAKKEIDGYPKLKDAMVIFTDALMPKHVKKGTKKASAADAAGKGGAKGKGAGAAPAKSAADKCKVHPKNREEAQQMYSAYLKAQSGAKEVIFDQYCIAGKRRETVQFENGVQLILK